MWEELQNYSSTKVCTCEAASDIQKEREDDRVHKFLFGLNLPRFSNIRSTITGEDPLPPLNQVYSRVIREEQNQNIAQVRETAKTEGIGFFVKTESQLQVAAVSGQRYCDRSSLSCTHCRRQGHEVSECFALHGYPDWYYEQNPSANRGSRGPNQDNKSVQRGGRGVRGTGRGRGRVNSARAASVSENGSDQISQFIQLLQAQRPSTSSEKLSGKTNLTDVIIDTGASYHMTGDLSLLINVVDIASSPVRFPNGNASRATKRGVLPLGSNYLLNDVLFVPDFDCTLISVSKLLKQTGCVAIFTDTLCFLQDRFSRTLIGAGEEREGVYYFTGVLAARAHKVSEVVKSSGTLWHRRLGHPALGVLLSLQECDQSSSAFGEIRVVIFVFVLNKQEKLLMMVIIKLWIVFLLFMLMSGDLIEPLRLVVQFIFRP